MNAKKLFTKNETAQLDASPRAHNALHDIATIPIYGSLIVVFCMVLVTLVDPVMIWVWVLCACSVTIAYMRIRRNLPVVKNLTLNLLAVFCMVLLIYLSGRYGIMATMVNLLVVAACLKIINLHTRGDYYVILIVLFFLVACGFIYHQNIYLVAYYFSCIVILFVTAFLLNKGALSISGSVKQSVKMILQALPITLALFVVVPRLPPFWQTNADSSTQTGLSEEITPGDIANLAQSDDLVFRAEFDNQIPEPQERYWRSIVLDHFDGKTWKISNQYRRYNTLHVPNKSLLKQQSPKDYRYLVVAEPNDTRWLYSLDIPYIEQTIGGVKVKMNNQYQLFQEEVNASASLYILHSFVQAELNAFQENRDFARYLQVPEQSNEKTQQWVRENVSDTMSFSEKITVLNGFFLNNDFVYTLQPPLMQSAPVDEFLFSHQKGFCSHYASALTYMLRLSNIPARLVAGYQGGDEAGDKILSVHQYDAHAWVEAFHADKGWVRFDPTALIAPERTSFGLMAALSPQESAVFNGEIGGFFDKSIFAEIREKLAIIDHKWNQLVLGFNNDSQSDLIEKLFGELNRKNLTSFLLLALGAIIVFMAFLFIPYKKIFTIQRKTSLDKLFILLKKYNYTKSTNESLEQFSNRIKQHLPTDAQDLLALFVKQYYVKTYQENSKVSEKDLTNTYEQIVKCRLVGAELTHKA